LAGTSTTARRRRPAAGRCRGPGHWRPPLPSAVAARWPPRPAVGLRPGWWPAGAAGRGGGCGGSRAAAVNERLWRSMPTVITGAFRRGGEGRSHEGQPDFRWAHASVEPRPGGYRPQPGTLSASQPHRVARSCEPDGRHPGRYGLQTLASWPAFNKSGDSWEAQLLVRLRDLIWRSRLYPKIGRVLSQWDVTPDGPKRCFWCCALGRATRCKRPGRLVPPSRSERLFAGT
jgi:hypothetical protein